MNPWEEMVATRWHSYFTDTYTFNGAERTATALPVLSEWAPHATELAIFATLHVRKGPSNSYPSTAAWFTLYPGDGIPNYGVYPDVAALGLPALLNPIGMPAGNPFVSVDAEDQVPLWGASGGIYVGRARFLIADPWPTYGIDFVRNNEPDGVTSDLELVWARAHVLFKVDH